MNEMNMSVWLVAGFFEYGGMYEPSLQLFLSQKDAMAYAEELEKDFSQEVRVWAQPVG